MIMNLIDALWYGLKFAVFAIGSVAVLVAAFVLIVIWLERRERNRRGGR
jgi:bacteriorhodopsin